MKHVSSFTALLLASVSSHASHAACPEETPYLAPVDMQPQCEPPPSIVSDASDELDTSETSADDSSEVKPTAKSVPDNNSAVVNSRTAQ